MKSDTTTSIAVVLARKAGDIVEDLVKRLIDAAQIQGEAQKQGNAVAFNRQQEEITQLREALRQRFSEAAEQIKALLQHENSHVRFHAALTLMPIAPDDTRRTLVQLSEEQSLLGLTAEMTLQEWDAGRLKI